MTRAKKAYQRKNIARKMEIKYARKRAEINANNKNEQKKSVMKKKELIALNKMIDPMLSWQCLLILF